MEKILLLVDDESAMLRTLGRVLRNSGYTLLMADNGSEAIRLVREYPVSVMLTDYTMPVINGAELLTEANQIRPEMTKLVFSGNADQASVINLINDVGIFQFITKPWRDSELKEKLSAAFEVWEERIFHLGITDLFHQDTFVQEVQEHLDNEPASESLLMYMEFNDYDQIREVIGNDQERDLLNSLTRHFVQHLGSRDKIAMMRNGLFAVYLDNVKTESEATLAIAEYAKRIGDQMSFKNHHFRITFHAGYALSQFDGRVASDLVGKAHTALNYVRSSPASGYVHFQKRMNERFRHSAALQRNLAAAVGNDEMVLHFQPKIDLRDKHVCGAEALLRWHSPSAGRVSPLEFIPLAEKTGLIREIGNWALVHATRKWSKWFAQTPRAPRLSINVSPRQLTDLDFADSVASAVESSGINPTNLELEITESVLVDNLKHARDTLEKIKSFGVKISIDDFGTGYSSLSYLSQLPLDILKIDRSFISNMLRDRESYDLVKNMVNIGHDLNLEIVAEGVEYEEEIDHLKALGCDVAQGYYYSPPLDGGKFSEFLMGYAL